MCVCEEILKLKVAKIELRRLKPLPLNHLKPERGQMNQMNTTVINTHLNTNIWQTIHGHKLVQHYA